MARAHRGARRRGARERALELRAAGTWLRVRGRLPDLSLGVAQLRPSTVRPALAAHMGGERLPDGELLALLADDCQNVRLAGLHVASLIGAAVAATPDAPGDTIVARVARAYAGATSPAVNGLRHEDAVRGAYDLLVLYGGFEPTDGGAPRSAEREAAGAEAPRAVPSERTVCVEFAMGEIAPYAHEGLSARLLGQDGGEGAPPVDSAARVAAERVTLVGGASERAPPGYLARLTEARLRRITGHLQALGYDTARVVIAPAPPRYPRRGCDAGDAEMGRDPDGWVVATFRGTPPSAEPTPNGATRPAGARR